MTTAEVIETVFKSARTVVLRMRRDGGTFIQKMPAADVPDARELARYRHEERLLEKAAADGVIKGLGVEARGGSLSLLMEDVGGRSLDLWIRDGAFSPASALPLLVELAEILARVHARGVVHNDVNPANVVWSRDSGALRLIDFSIGSALVREAKEPAPARRLQGTLRYLAPEQTGRMNRGVDHRADLYSLGATAWHLLAGRPPFESADPLELIHAHLARIPPPLSSLGVPASLSEVVAKLLAKQPEDRYQSAEGAAADLRACLTAEGSFPLGARDRPLRFSVPDRLYGRDEERRVLLDALGAHDQDQAGLVLVEGPAGIGKSAIIDELRKPVSEAHGGFTSGRFDLLRRDVPLLAVTTALGALMKELLADDAARVERMKQELAAELRGNAGLLTRAVPELRHILGETEEPGDIDIEEARNRMNVAYASLLRVLVKERPLVLVLDDLQWADSASLSLIEFLATDATLGKLLLVCAYRDEEAEGIRRVIDTLERQGVRARKIRPGPLGVEDTARITASACRCRFEEALELAPILHTKSGGNPFHLRALLERLHEDGVLKAQGAGWTWDLDAVKRAAVTENVVRLMEQEIRRLPDDAQSIVAIAACLGHAFRFDVLTAASGKPAGDVARALWPAMERNLILPDGSDYQLVELLPRADVRYRFTHDRVYEAAYALVPEDARATTHLAIGRLLLAREPEPESSDALFDIVGHLGRGASLMTDKGERRRFAELALSAARRARGSAAFDHALASFESGLAALGDERWSEHRALAIALSEGAADAAYFARKRNAMDGHVDQVIAHAGDLLSEVPVWTTRIRALMADGDMAGAYQASEVFLSRAGRPQPTSGSKPALAFALARTWLALGGRTPDELVELPEVKDPLLRAVQDIQVLVAPAQGMVRPDLIPVAILRDVRTTLADGVTGMGAQCWTGLGIILAEGFGRGDLSAEFGELSVRQVERLGHLESWPRVKLMALIQNKHWTTPLSEMILELRRAHTRCLELGDFQSAMSCICIADWIAYANGAELASLAEQIGTSRRELRRFQDAMDVTFMAPLSEALATLLDASARSAPSFKVDEKTPGGAIAELGRASLELHLALVFGEARRAFDIASGRYAAMAAIGGSMIRVFATWAPVALLAGIGKGWKPDGWIRKRAAEMRKRLPAWVAGSPSTRTFRLTWIDAADLASRGKVLEALARYDEAIDGAKEAGARGDAALIAEQAARLAERAGRGRIARAYRIEALARYRQWGARAKEAQLTEEVPDLVRATTAGTGSTSADTTTDAGAVGMDLETVARASRAIAGEIRLEGLVRHLLAIALENAGAERGWLLLRGDDDGMWHVAAQAGVGGEVTVARDAGDPDLPLAIVRYPARTREPVVLDDAARDGPFTEEPYVRKNKPRSVLCFPLADRRVIAGIIYLENNLASGAFTPDRLEVLRLLGAQMAIAIENARLYENLDAALAAQVALTEAHKRFVPQDFLDNLRRRSIADVQLGDSVEKEMSILFSDIRSFTALVEGLRPDENIDLINGYLRRMEPAILQHGGFVDSYIGDAIMALFEHGAESAIAAGVDMLRALSRYNVERKAQGRAPIAIGVGVNTGLLTLGTIGGENRIKCGVIGDCVNLASRVESLTKTYGVPLLTTEHSRRRLPPAAVFEMRVVDRVRVKGRVEPVTLYEVFDADDPRTLDTKRARASRWDEALALYHARSFSEAHRLFTEHAAALPDDPVAALYVSRTSRFSATPPPPGWDAVEEMDHK